MSVKEGDYTAIRYFQEVEHTIKVGKDIYNFVVKRNICMAWVRNEHVDAVLNMTKTCCGGQKRHPYRFAEDHAVTRWSGLEK